MEVSPAVVTKTGKRLLFLAVFFFSFLYHIYPGLTGKSILAKYCEGQRFASHMCGSYPLNSLPCRKTIPPLLLVCLENSASLACLGSLCIFRYLFLASPEMTSVRKLVSRGAMDSITGVWWIAALLAAGSQAFFNS